MPSPLFKNFTAFQQAALREFRGTDVGKLVSEVKKLSKGGKVSQSTARHIEKQMNQLSKPGRLKSIISKTEFGQLASEVDKYARGEVKQLIMEGLFKSLGPVGDMLRGLLRPRGKQLAGVDRELQAASDLLKAFGFEVKSPSRRPAAQRRFDESRMARDLLESLGFTVTPPQTRTRTPQRIREPEPEPAVETRKIGGRERKYKPDDPILTGELIEVQSSNVHSIGFIWNDEDPMNGTLQIRFLQNRRGSNSRGPGPLYYYSGVHPNVFDAFRRAASKGEFVWDRIRIRGTVSGHRFPYELKGITGGYVPRQAKRYGGNEYYVQRRVRGKSTRTGQVRTFESELPDRLVGRGEAQRPSFGLPNRGRTSVNRGAPNRGR